ncbi:MAG: DUF4406 domain-containing protein [Pseudomonadota bacterium]
MSWLMVAGPYRAGGAQGAALAANLRALNEAALAIFEKGHTPVIGVNMALPMIEAAGPERYDDLMMPISLALVERCDGLLRIGGRSAGADREVARMRALKRPVYFDLSEVPEVAR